ELLQFHFHTPSEHMVDGKPFAAEVHFVHRAADGELAVIGAFIDGKAGGQALAEVVSRAPAVKTSAWTYSWVTVDPAAIMPAPHSFWSYGGSLTTPPCSEGVRWMMQRMPLALSTQHIAALEKAMGANARPVQPVNGRAVAAPR
ncbi:MAG TPA: carbonic anhydrase family protein, partial [Thalassobaculum sp.]